MGEQFRIGDHHRAVVLGVASFVSSSVAPATVRAADTTEAWDIGATNYEYYLAYHGIGLVPEDQTLTTEAVAGFGLLPRLSGGFGAVLVSNTYLVAPEVGLEAWLFSTPYDSDHFDFDFLFTSAVGGQGLNEIALVPGVELNVDTPPDLSGFGVYLRAEEAFSGVDTTPAPTPASESPEPRYERTYATCALIGAYVAPTKGHHVLVEADAALFHGSQPERSHDIGGLALGYNVFVTERLELISQVALDIPQGAEAWSAGVSVGMIVTLPGGGG